MKRFIPSIPDIMGWILTFLVLWLVYTAVTRGAEFVSSINFWPEKKSDSEGAEDVSERFKKAARSVASDVTETFNDLKSRARKERQRLRGVEPRVVPERSQSSATTPDPGEQF